MHAYREMPAEYRPQVVPGQSLQYHRVNPSGEMAEWIKAHAWKVCYVNNVSRVRIPLSFIEE